METQNFYLLLELPIDPPENDPAVIEQAINKKQSEWSRYRNHPTKATLAQKNIDLLPDIRDVMGDEKKRLAEAKRAHRLLLREQKQKTAALDRHIALHMSKGSMTRKEFAGLAKLHGVPVTEVLEAARRKEKSLLVKRRARILLDSGKSNARRIAALSKKLGVNSARLAEWITRKKDSNDAEMTAYVARCERRGFIHEAEVALLMRLYSFSREEIIRHVNFPLRKSAVKEHVNEGIEKTIERLISNKLKIVGKDNLYDFLGLPVDSNIEDLKEQSSQKEMEFRKIGIKNAHTTASCALAGHAVIIFRNEENRRKYDNSLVHARIDGLNDEIDAAGAAQQIWPEYINILIRFATTIGMDIDDAENYIRRYCAERKWKIEKKPLNPERKRELIKWAVISVSSITFLAASVSLFFYVKHSRHQNAYEAALAKAAQQPELEGRQIIYTAFLRQYPETAYKDELHRKLTILKKDIRIRDTEIARKKAEAAMAAGNMDLANDVYEAYLKLYPNTAEAETIRDLQQELFREIDEMDYEKIRVIPLPDYETRRNNYEYYSRKHPEGKFLEEAEALVTASVTHYFDILKKEVARCEGDASLEKCLEKCNTFIERFPNRPQTEAVEEIKKKFLNRLQRYSDLSEMKEKAEAMGEDFEGARLIYLDYLEANPEITSALKKLIVKEIKFLDGKIKEQEKTEKQWQEAYLLSQDINAEPGRKIARMQSFVDSHPQHAHAEEARLILARLQKEKAAQDQRALQKRRKREFEEALAMAANSAIPLPQRVKRLQAYLSGPVPEDYQRTARVYLQKLQQQLSTAREQDRQRQILAARRKQALDRVRRIVNSSSGRFRDNGDGSILDTASGLTWTALDAYTDTGRCYGFEAAQELGAALRTSGRSDWRLPTAKELAGLLASPQIFASDRLNWLWTSETFWHGWNKRVIVYMVQSGNWKKASTGANQCGSALFVH